MAGIRGVRPDDRDALYAVVWATGHEGGDAAALYRDPRLRGHVYAGPYAALHPELVLVAEDAGGVAGYVLGTADTRAFEDRQEAEWWPPLRAAYPDPADTPPDRRTADQQRCHRIHRSEEHTSELQSLMPISDAVFCLKKNKIQTQY